MATHEYRFKLHYIIEIHRYFLEVNKRNYSNIILVRKYIGTIVALLATIVA